MSGNTLSDSHLRAWRALLNGHAAAVKRIDDKLRAEELLPLDWYDVLLELFEAPDHRLRLSDLADAVVLTRSGLSRLVTRLGKAGYVIRRSCDQDGRGTYAVLTEAGERAFRDTWPAYARQIKEFFADHLSEEEATVLYRALERVRTAAGRCA